MRRPIRAAFLQLTCLLYLVPAELRAQNEKQYSQAEFEEAVRKKVSVELERAMEKVGKGNLVDLSKQLLQKEEALRLKELELSKFKEQVELGAKEFEAKIKKFQEEQARVLGCIDNHDKDKQKRVAHMVESISSMKPQVAADVLSVQDPDISVRIMGLLEPTKVSKIMNLMNKEISARLQKQYLDMKK